MKTRKKKNERAFSSFRVLKTPDYSYPLIVQVNILAMFVKIESSNRWHSYIEFLFDEWCNQFHTHPRVLVLHLQRKKIINNKMHYRIVEVLQHGPDFEVSGSAKEFMLNRFQVCEIIKRPGLSDPLFCVCERK